MTTIILNGKPVVLQNADCNPLHNITYQKAALLLARGKAIIVESDPVQKFGEWALPKVMRLKEYVYIAWEKLNGPPRVTKRHVLQRDGRACAYCRGHATTIDHVHPRSKGGKNTWENLVAACLDCNHKKRNRTPEEAGMKLRWKGWQPTRAQLQ